MILRFELGFKAVGSVKVFILTLEFSNRVKMRSLQAPVVCPSVRPRQLGVSASLVNCSVSKPRILRNQFWGNQTRNVKSQLVATVSLQLHLRRCKSIKCHFSSHSDGTGSTAENFNENDEDYVKSSVLEAGTAGLSVY